MMTKQIFKIIKYFNQKIHNPYPIPIQSVNYVFYEFVN